MVGLTKKVGQKCYLSRAGEPESKKRVSFDFLTKKKEKEKGPIAFPSMVEYPKELCPMRCGEEFFIEVADDESKGPLQRQIFSVCSPMPLYHLFNEGGKLPA